MPVVQTRHTQTHSRNESAFVCTAQKYPTKARPAAWRCRRALHAVTVGPEGPVVSQPRVPTGRTWDGWNTLSPPATQHSQNADHTDHQRVEQRGLTEISVGVTGMAVNRHTPR